MQIYKQIILHNFLVFFFISLNPIVGQEKDKKEIDSIVKGINAQTGIQKLASFDYLFDNYKRKDPQLVLNHIDQAVELAENLGDSQASINFYKYKGTSNSFTGKTQQAIKSFNTAINKAAVLKDTVLQAKSIHALGSHYNRIGNYKEAEIQYIKAKKLAQKVGCQKILLQTDYNLGTLFINRGLDKKAKEIFERLLAQCPISALDCNGILLNNAICTYKLGNPSKALDMLFEVKKIDEINEHHLRVQYSNHHIAYILESVGLYEEALIYYDEVLNYFNGQADLRQQVAVNGTIGVLMMKLGRYKESKTYLQKSLILQKENGMSAYGRTLIDLGKLTFQQELIDQATSYYKKAYPLLKDVKDKRGLCLLYLGEAEIAIHQNELAKAKEAVERVLFIGKKLGLIQLQIDAYSKLGVIYEKQKEFEKSLTVRDSIEFLNIGFADKTTTLAINKKLVEKKLAQKQVKISKLEEVAVQEKYKRIIIITVISFGFIAILASVFYFNRRKLWKSRFTIKTTLGDKEANDLAQRLNKVMQTKKPYLDEDLTLIKLAELMSSTQKKLSVVLNNHLQTNFYDYVNKYRVQAFKEMIENPAYKEYGTLGVANECGFKSKSSFYRVFKKETGLSPGIYKRQILEKIVP